MKQSIVQLYSITTHPIGAIPCEEGKLCELWNKAQQAQWACWRVQDVHIHMPNEGKAHPLAWAPSRDEGPDLPITFQETCSTSKRGLSSKPRRLVQQVWVTSSASLWGLLCKERRQDLTIIKRPQHPQKRYVWVINPSLALWSCKNVFWLNLRRVFGRLHTGPP